MTYKAPVRDLIFSLRHAAGAGRLEALFPGFDDDTLGAVLDHAGALAADVLAPIDRAGDLEGARLENGAVRAAPGFADAYRQFAEGGWNGLSADAEFGGQGLPKALEVAVFEMMQGANMAFSLCPMLTLAAIEALHQHGTDRQKRLYMPNLISGRWTGTMNLTEPQSGSDLAAIATRATPDGDGYRLNGQKIFITWGDHDVAENIVHLVLARVDGAPPGSRGLSLFLCPKRRVGEDGALGEANGVRPASLERKLGVHASPTCVMLYEDARAELVGAANQGLAAMFVMMNSARLHVGAQGVGVAERAFQGALAYALERRQGRSAWTGTLPSRLFDHPDVRRTLMLMKARIEAARGLCLATAVAGDLARRAGNPVDRDEARLREDLLTPIAKAWSTDMAVEVASMGLQVHGGMGFIEETGAAQPYRDARVLPIYEGTNGIQAIDLMGRKLALGKGQAVRELVSEIFPTASAMKSADDAWLHTVGARLEAGLAAVQSATGWLIERRGHAQPDALAGATPYLKLMGDVVGGWMLAKGALVASEKLAAGEGPADYLRGKIALARVFAEQVLSAAPAQAQAVSQGAIDLFRATPEALGA
ncbi:MAG: acyl-CoA dehydrogenase C-terminal domain-containing protein [Caulobacteraceae bacterium]|nr:acyl-CoA dehydrogenase C-terminal domain-containing protein [Caulobacteraceae bacterium]